MLREQGPQDFLVKHYISYYSHIFSIYFKLLLASCLAYLVQLILKFRGKSCSK